LSREEDLKKEKASEAERSDKKENTPSTATPTERDPYVYKTIIAEIGYRKPLLSIKPSRHFQSPPRCQRLAVKYL